MDVEHEQNIICGTVDIIVSLPSYASDWKRCDGLNMNPPYMFVFSSISPISSIYT